jgi:hypothetical protein
LTKDITEVRGKTSEKVGSKSGKGEFVFEVVTKARTYYFAPDDSKARDEWTAAIKSWIGYNEDVSTKEQPKPGASNRAASPEKPIDDKELAAKPDAAGDAASSAATSTDTTATTTTTTSTSTESTPAATTTSSEATTSSDAAKTDAPSTPRDSGEKKDEQHSDDEKPAANGGDAASSSSSSAAPAASGGDAPAAENEIVKYEAQYDYEAQEENEVFNASIKICSQLCGSNADPVFFFRFFNDSTSTVNGLTICFMLFDFARRV